MPAAAACPAHAAAPARQDGAGAGLLRLERALSDSSAASGFAAALGGVLDSAAVYLHPGAPVVAGAANVRALLAADPALAAVAVEWRAEHLELARDSSFALTWGVATSRPRDGGPLRFGRYIAAWRRADTGGSWRLAALATSGVFAAAALPAGASGSAAIEPRAAAFADADRAFAALAGRQGAAEAFARYAASDAVTFGAGGLLRRGPAAIRAPLAGDSSAWRWRPVAGGASRGGDIGFTVGESAITPRGGAETFYGKYLTAWRRESSGPRFIADIGNARPAAVSTP